MYKCNLHDLKLNFKRYIFKRDYEQAKSSKIFKIKLVRIKELEK